MVKVELDGGKYEVAMDQNGLVTAKRHGEPWRDCVGDNLIYWLTVELFEAKEILRKAKNCLCTGEMSDPREVCESTLQIIKGE